MNALPASIEAYLLEAGFSQTEILILKRLLEQDAMTLRELAAKTGKSTGVLDQAMKKLLRKSIVSKEWVNDGFKFTLISLESVSKWMGDDMRRKREELARRHQNFQTFLSTLELDKKRPEMQYYEGEEGIKQAYMRVLEEKTELLQHVPVAYTVEEDPLRDFRVEYFRERRRRGVFARVIAHDTMLGRRYQSRDPFEYRQTVLVPEDQYKFGFEKIIAGDTITCINHKESRACFIKYPELASIERTMFENIWKHQSDAVSASSPAPAAIPAPVPSSEVPLKTRTLSRLREYFLSRSSLITMCVLAMVAGGITYGLYRYTSDLNLQRLKTEVQSIANTAAYDFDVKDLDQLRVESDWHKPEWAKVVNKLKAIKTHNDDILYAYIFRKSDEINHIIFVADADSINPYANSDNDPTNNVDLPYEGEEPVGSDQLQWPGQIYDTAPPEAFAAFKNSITSNVYQDQWGKLITGYAPIKNNKGQVVDVLAIDVQASRLNHLNSNSIAPILLFIFLFLVFLAIRFAAFNRSLFKETWSVLQMRKIIAITALCAEISFGITFFMYWSTIEQVKSEVGNKLMTIAATAAPSINVADLDQLHFARDMKKEAYQRVFRQLNEIRDNNLDVEFAYIQRPIKLPYLWEFIVDADSNYNLPLLGKDFNKDNKIDNADENVWPGDNYFGVHDHMYQALRDPSFEKDTYPTKWGTLISGYAPIKDKNGESIAILGFDTNISEILKRTNEKFIPWLCFMVAFLCLLFIKIILNYKKKV
jgi:predicted transcriptional regulator